jgi:thymidylate synthase
MSLNFRIHILLMTDPNHTMHDEQQYIDLVNTIINTGTKRVGRNNAVTYSIFGHTSRYSLRNNKLPVLTTKKVFTRGIIEELLWFLSGSSDANVLKDKNVHIWDGHTSREHYESCGLEYEDGDVGPSYGHQWRHSGAEFKGMQNNYDNNGIDQISNVVKQLKETPMSRRHVVCSWVPSDIPKMVLPPCHCLFQFYVDEEGLSCQMYQRSGDVGLGVPFNISSYALLTHLIAREVGIKAKEFIHVIGDAHIYEEHIEALKSQITRHPYEFPTIEIDDVDILNAGNFHILNYQCHPSIKMKMVV